MTEYSLPYGKEHLNFQIPDGFLVENLDPETSQPMPEPLKAIEKALATPLGKRTLKSFIGAGSIGIAINDKTRPVPRTNPIAPLLKYLETLGFDQKSITLFIGSGTHSPMLRTELTRILDQKIVDRYAIVIHDCDHSEMVDLGKTSYNTPVLINAGFFRCDLKITVGNIEPHHFMGFSGGVKTAVIGLASRLTINTNHAMLSHPKAHSGIFHLNPMRQDLEEMGRKANIHFSLGTILDEEKQILEVLFGDPISVMKAAIPVIKNIFGISVPQPYDLVIASPGGAPKDMNLYQAQKGLTHAARVTRDGGWVILLAACPEGSGSPAYETLVTSSESHQSIIKQFEEGYFAVGPHKAFQIAREAVRVKIVLVSDIPPQDVKRWMLTPSSPELLTSLIRWITDKLPQDARIAVMPAATRTMAEVNHETK